MGKNLRHANGSKNVLVRPEPIHTAGPSLTSLKRHLAFAAISPTTLRNMFDRPGSRGVICEELAGIDLDELGNVNVHDALDQWTRHLALLTGAWGPSRKALNLFLRDVSYNHWMRAHFGFERFEHSLEIPLDGVVMTKLRNLDPSLPRPPAVKRLHPESSELFQNAASRIAENRGVARVHLDIELWHGGTREKPEKIEKNLGSSGI